MRTRDSYKELLVKQKAIEMIGRDGLEGFTVSKLAKACNISVATLYIYYKDKDDLITKIAVEEGKAMGKAMIENFDPEAPFEEGLRVQWKNRYRYMIDHPQLSPFFEKIRSSGFQERFLDSFLVNFEASVGRFMKNIIARGEIREMPVEIYWSIAFAPLYALIRFHHEGRSLGRKPFKMNDELLWQSFDLVVKALKT